MSDNADFSARSSLNEGADGEPPVEVQRFINALADRFLFETKLRSSGTAIVYRVRQRNSDQVLVLKVFRTVFSESSVQIFSKHVESARRLAHPQIVPMLE